MFADSITIGNGLVGVLIIVVLVLAAVWLIRHL